MAAITTTDGQYGANVIGAGLGTLGANAISKIRTAHPFSNQIIKPIFSGVVSEYLNDRRVLEEKGGYNEGYE
ncbi:hypothetical protein [Chelonobacter oris]|uniref:hypothetical protein n=1 Tax=Chelonobacter oris TaxID=505317 RepID=UPI002449947F|nr:hypothetical protein [Chelonobacter oris]